jgi:UDP-2,3-diacylglucosamine hydrolase
VSTLFISDLHLDEGEPAAGAQFVDFLKERVANADALYILGDLFETWVGDDDDDPYRDRICGALAAATDVGVPCYVMRGNRDFLFQSQFEARTGTRVIADPLLIELYGEEVLLTHGDLLCTADHSYQRLRGVVRNPRWQRRFLSLPLGLRRVLADQARQGSQRHTQRAAKQIMDVDVAAVSAAMRACAVRTLIHGHTHRPGVHQFELDGQSAQRIVLGAWHDSGSCLEWGPDGFQLQTLPRACTQSRGTG